MFSLFPSKAIATIPAAAVLVMVVAVVVVMVVVVMLLLHGWVCAALVVLARA